MLDPRQDRVLRDLARSIAHSLDVLGDTCTARLLGSIALGLMDKPEPDQTIESKAPATRACTNVQPKRSPRPDMAEL